MTKYKSNLSQKELKDVLHYNPETGVFTWLVGRGGVNVGDIAGNIATRHSGKKYMFIGVNNRGRFASHRLAFLYMTGSFPKNDTDHEDGNGLNNKWENLKDVTNSENHKNVKKQANNTSGTTGVRMHNAAKKWVARIYDDGKEVHLGLFDNYEDAVSVRKEAEKKYGYHINHGVSRPL